MADPSWFDEGVNLFKQRTGGASTTSDYIVAPQISVDEQTGSVLIRGINRKGKPFLDVVSPDDVEWSDDMSSFMTRPRGRWLYQFWGSSVEPHSQLVSRTSA